MPQHSEIPSGQRILVAVVADEAGDREALSSAFAAAPGYRVLTSCAIDKASITVDPEETHVIVGFVGDEDDWRRFRSMAEIFPRQISVLFVNDPDAVDRADGTILNAVVGVPRHELARQAAAAAADVVRTFSIRGSTVPGAARLDAERLEKLTEREREILVLTAEGLALKEIARSIGRSYATVVTHRNNIMEKLGLHDRVALTRFAIRTGLVEA